MGLYSSLGLNTHSLCRKFQNMCKINKVDIECGESYIVFEAEIPLSISSKEDAGEMAPKYFCVLGNNLFP